MKAVGNFAVIRDVYSRVRTKVYTHVLAMCSPCARDMSYELHMEFLCHVAAVKSLPALIYSADYILLLVL